MHKKVMDFLSFSGTFDFSKQTLLSHEFSYTANLIFFKYFSCPILPIALIYIIC